MQNCEAAGVGDSGLYPGAGAEGATSASGPAALHAGDRFCDMHHNTGGLLGHRRQLGVGAPQQLLRQRARLHDRRVHRGRPPGIPAGLGPDRAQQVLLEQLQSSTTKRLATCRRRAMPFARGHRPLDRGRQPQHLPARTASGTTGAAARCSSAVPDALVCDPPEHQAGCDPTTTTSHDNRPTGTSWGAARRQARSERHGLLVGQLGRQQRELLVATTSARAAPSAASRRCPPRPPLQLREEPRHGHGTRRKRELVTLHRGSRGRHRAPAAPGLRAARAEVARRGRLVAMAGALRRRSGRVDGGGPAWAPIRRQTARGRGGATIGTPIRLARLLGLERRPAPAQRSAIIEGTCARSSPAARPDLRAGRERGAARRQGIQPLRGAAAGPTSAKRLPAATSSTSARPRSRGGKPA